MLGIKTQRGVRPVHHHCVHLLFSITTVSSAMVIIIFPSACAVTKDYGVTGCYNSYFSPLLCSALLFCPLSLHKSLYAAAESHLKHLHIQMHRLIVGTQEPLSKQELLYSRFTQWRGALIFCCPGTFPGTTLYSFTLVLYFLGRVHLKYKVYTPGMFLNIKRFLFYFSL